MSYSRHIYHIVTGTKYRRNTIPESTKRVLLTYIYKLCNSHGWILHRINACFDHMHLLIELPGTTMPDDVIRIIKSMTSRVFNHSKHFPNFEGWARGYASMTVSYYEIPHISNYINSQLEHHHGETFAQEYRRLLGEHGFAIDDADNNPTPDKDSMER